MLYTINHATFSNTIWQLLAAHDVVLLLENGVYAANAPSLNATELQRLIKRAQLYALMPDVSARGLQDKLLAGLKTIDYNGFVALACEHDQVLLWH